jgi:hypothetical protein
MFKQFVFLYVTMMTWAGHVARMGRKGIHVVYWWEARRKNDIDGWTILK